jgi:hypothetical protein
MSWNSAPLASTPVWARDFASPEELVKEFNRECRIVQKGLEGDIKKAVKDGKPVIIEVLISRQFNNLVLSLLSMCQKPLWSHVRIFARISKNHFVRIIRWQVLQDNTMGIVVLCKEPQILFCIVLLGYTSPCN